MLTDTDREGEVTAADCEAAADLIESYWFGAEVAHEKMRELAAWYRAGHTQGVWAHAFGRHRTASTAALTAEIQRLREALSSVRADILNENGLNGQSITCTVWHDSCETTVDFIAAALSTPSEVSEPVADESGGEGEKKCWSCGGLNTSCPDGCGRDPKTGELNGTRAGPTPTNPTNGDAVREALEATQTLLEQIDHHSSTNFRAVRERIVANRAALNHGGTQG